MPTYVYRCRDCQKSVEIIQRFTDDPLTICPHCGGALQRVLFAPAIIFKGSGWYSTDHKSPSGVSFAKAEEASQAGGNGGEAAPTEAAAAGAKPGQPAAEQGPAAGSPKHSATRARDKQAE